MKPDNQSEIENEIRETAALEANSTATDLPNTVARNINPFAEKVDHTDTGVDVVVVVDVDEPGPFDPPPDVVIEPPSGIDIDVETHVDQ
jgi:hypothetical protein